MKLSPLVKLVVSQIFVYSVLLVLKVTDYGDRMHAEVICQPKED